MSYRRYARELKEQACALVIEEKYDPADAGRQLGIPEMTLRGWLAQYFPAAVAEEKRAAGTHA